MLAGIPKPRVHPHASRSEARRPLRFALRYTKGPRLSPSFCFFGRPPPPPACRGFVPVRAERRRRGRGLCCFCTKKRRRRLQTTPHTPSFNWREIVCARAHTLRPAFDPPAEGKRTLFPSPRASLPPQRDASHSRKPPAFSSRPSVSTLLCDMKWQLLAHSHTPRARARSDPFFLI
jgi:hypothetical protein